MNKTIRAITLGALIGASSYLPATASEPVAPQEKSGLECTVEQIAAYQKQTLTKVDAAKLVIQYKLFKGMRDYCDEQIASRKEHGYDFNDLELQRGRIQRSQKEIVKILSYTPISGYTKK